ncbi:MAG: glycogen synthase GlgA [Thermoplasmata archaeon]|nr:glycogen synthase GlgA [Thermoplasmata archaeon]
MAEHSKKLKVLVASSEVAPLAKTGGLADVSGTLPKALVQQGVDARIIMPRYKNIEKWERTLMDFPVCVEEYPDTAIIRETQIWGSVKAYLVDCYRYFERSSLYGQPDDAKRFAFFARAVIEFLKRYEWKPDIIHCNDWQTGIIPAYLRVVEKEKEDLAKIRTVFTIHNLQYQGNFPREAIKYTGLPESVFRMEEMEFYGQLSFMKGGIVYADAVTTVSPNYAREIQTQEYGYGMEGLLRYISPKLSGILNGIDTEFFNPETDRYLYQNYGIENAVAGKRKNKLELQKELGLKPEPEIPLLTYIGRLSEQKGIDLIADILPKLLDMDVQVVILGTGDKYYEELVSTFREVSEKIACVLKFDEELAHKLYGGADIILIPSKFEPCGLIQMIAMRYGTIPIARYTGGLADTVFDVDTNKEMGNGFLFTNYLGDAFMKAILRALEHFNRKELWYSLVKKDMKLDFSWTRAAQEYIKLYSRMV